MFQVARLGVIALALMLTSMTTMATEKMSTPRAAQKPHTVKSPFGERQDPWYWLRDDERQNPEMLAYLKAENDHLAAVMAPHRELEQKIYDEIIGRLKQDDSTVPQRRNGYWYYSRYETGKQYPIYARKKGSLEAAEEIIIDGNARATGREFYQLAELEVSVDGRWAAIAEDFVGRRQYEVRIKDLQSGEFLSDVLTNVEANLAWANDNVTLLYIRKDPQTLLGNAVYKHRRGTEMTSDSLVYQQEDDSFYMGIGKSKTDRFLFIVSQSTVSSEYQYADANDPALSFKVALPRERDHEYQLEDIGDRFIIRTNWQAKNFRIVEVPIEKVAERNRWRDVIAHRSDAFVDSFEAFDGFLAVSERSGGLQNLRVHSWSTGESFLMDAADPAYTMYLGNNTESNTTLLRYVYTSPTTPSTTYDYDVSTGKKKELKREPVLGGFDSANYVAEYRWATARDGVKIPVTLLYRRGTSLDGTAPLYQYAYGSYGSSTDPTFRSTILSLVDRGFVKIVVSKKRSNDLVK